MKNNPNNTFREKCNKKTKKNNNIVESGGVINSLKDVGLIFKLLRKKKKMLQSIIAGLSNVGNRFISELENGKPTMQFDKVLKVLRDNGITLTINYPPIITDNKEDE